MKLLGWNLVKARWDAGEPDPRRTYDAPDVPARQSLNRRRCPHPRGRVMEWHGADGSRATVCTDCGTVLSGKVSA